MKKIFLIICLVTIGCIGGGDGNSDNQNSESGSDNSAWQLITNLPEPRQGMVSSELSDAIYIIGGWDGLYYEPLNTVFRYNLASDFWEKKNVMPTPRKNSGLAVVDKKIFVMGGNTTGKTLPLTNVVEVYDPVADLWETKMPMPTLRGRFATAAVNGKIYVIGGKKYPTESMPTGLVEEYDSETNTWTVKSSLLYIREGLTATQAASKIYAIGGDSNENVVEEYDPVTDSWSRKADIPSDYSKKLSVTINEEVYVIDWPGFVFKYNPLTDTWVSKSQMPEGFSEYSDKGAAVVVGNRIYVIGAGDSSTVYEYDPLFD